MKTLTMRGFVGRLAINGHALEAVEIPNGAVVISHMRYGWRSGIQRRFNSVADYEKFIAEFEELSSAQTLDKILGSMGVPGFPSIGEPS